MTLEAPFQYFGGKRKIAPVVWQRFGDVAHYIEPFCGSCAVLLARPDDHKKPMETVNDVDGFVTNFYRTVKSVPEKLADAVDWPINELDIAARQRFLCTQPDKAEFLSMMEENPTYWDLKRAAWWCWGSCCHIGSGWCEGDYHPDNPEKTSRSYKKLPHLASGIGVHRKLSKQELMQWMIDLCMRLRRVRVCCGDWSRVLTDSVLTIGSSIGVFLDPPYSVSANRADGVYRMDNKYVARDVCSWALEHGDNPKIRIALCGYEGEFQMPDTWECFAWKAKGGISKEGKQGRDNAERERVWFSPSCLKEISL